MVLNGSGCVGTGRENPKRRWLCEPWHGFGARHISQFSADGEWQPQELWAFISARQFNQRRLQLDFGSFLLHVPLASHFLCLNRTFYHQCYVPLPPNLFKMWIISLPPLVKQLLQYSGFFHHVLLSKGHQNSCNCQMPKFFLISGPLWPRHWSTDLQSTFLEMAPPVSVVCSTATSSQTLLTVFFTDCSSTPPKLLRISTINPLMVIPFYVTLASTKMTYKSLVLASTSILIFRHCLPTSK